MKEIWKDIKGFEGRYQVSNLGRVKSLKRTRNGKNGSVCVVQEKILTPYKNNCGYYCINLDNKCYLIHRLVAQAFVENPDPVNFNEINHKDENKSNNRCDNLEWCDRLYQVRYGNGIEKRVESRKKNYIPKPKIVKKKLILQYTKDGLCVGEYTSTTEAERQTGINGSGIRRCISNSLKTSGGYVWKRIYVTVISNFKTIK